MLSIQVSINGIPIIVANAYRDMSISTDPNAYMYRYSAACMSTDVEQSPRTYTGTVEHAYDNGLEALTQIIMKDIVRKKGKNNATNSRRAS
jgi:hypothetical protein